MANFYQLGTLPEHILSTNPTDKLWLPEDPQEIKEFNLTIPITSPAQLRDMARLLRMIYYFTKLPETWIEIKKKQKENEEDRKLVILPTMDKLKKDLQETNPEILKMIPIKEYSDTQGILKRLKSIYMINDIPEYILELPDLPMPEWEIFEF